MSRRGTANRPVKRTYAVRQRPTGSERRVTATTNDWMGVRPVLDASRAHSDPHKSDVTHVHICTGSRCMGTYEGAVARSGRSAGPSRHGLIRTIRMTSETWLICEGTTL